MKKKVKLILLGVAALAAVIAAVAYAAAPLAVPLTAVAAGPAELSFSESGLVVADRVVQVYPLTQGELLSVNVTEGQSVAEGDIICVIDPEPLRLKISRTQSGVAGYEAQMANLDAERDKQRSDLMASKNSLLGELKALEAQDRSSGAALETQNVSVEEQTRLQNMLIEQGAKDLERARNEFENITLLYNAGVVSRSEYEAAQAAASSAETALEAARTQLSVIAGSAGESSADYYRGMTESLNAQIGGIDRALARDYSSAMKNYYQSLIEGDKASIAQLEKDMANCAVAAPVGGVVTGLNAKSTNYVTAAAPVAEITATGSGTIEVYVSTKDVDSVRVGDTVGLTLKRREGDAKFTGRVSRVDENASVRLSALGVEERRVKVEVTPRMEELAGASFGVGFDVDVKFYAYYEENKLTAPKTALFKDDERDMLWVVRNGRAQAVQVVKGMELRTETVVEEGLADGDVIVTDANNKSLKENVRVKGE